MSIRMVGVGGDARSCSEHSWSVAQIMSPWCSRIISQSGIFDGTAEPRLTDEGGSVFLVPHVAC